MTSIIRNHSTSSRGSFQSIESGEIIVPMQRRRSPVCFILTSMAIVAMTNGFTFLCAMKFANDRCDALNQTFAFHEWNDALVGQAEALGMQDGASLPGQATQSVPGLSHEAMKLFIQQGVETSTMGRETTTVPCEQVTPRFKIDMELLKRKWMSQGIDEYKASLRGDADAHPDIFPKQNETDDYDYEGVVSFDGSFEIETVNGDFAVDRRGRMSKKTPTGYLQI